MTTYHRLQLAWLGKPPNCTKQYHDELNYYCQQYDSIRQAADVIHYPMDPAGAKAPAAADALLVPPQCSTNMRVLPRCIRGVLSGMPGYPPVVVMLNKAFEYLDEKLAQVRRLRPHLALVTLPTPHVA